MTDGRRKGRHRALQEGLGPICERGRKDAARRRGDDEALKEALKAGELVFHEGRIGGAWPQIVSAER